MPKPRNDKPAKKPVPMLTINGTEVPFKFNYNGLVDIETRLNSTIFAIARDLATNPSLKTMRIVVAGGFSDKDTIYTEEEAGAIIETHGLEVFMEAFADQLSGLLKFPDAVAAGLRGEGKTAKPDASIPA